MATNSGVNLMCLGKRNALERPNDAMAVRGLVFSWTWVGVAAAKDSMMLNSGSGSSRWVQETTELVDGWEENGQNGDGSLKSKSMVTWGRGEAGGGEREGD